MLIKGISTIIVRTVDFDVVVILMSFMSKFLDLDKNAIIYVNFGIGDTRRFINITIAYQDLEKRCHRDS